MGGSGRWAGARPACQRWHSSHPPFRDRRPLLGLVIVKTPSGRTCKTFKSPLTPPFGGFAGSVGGTFFSRAGSRERLGVDPVPRPRPSAGVLVRRLPEPVVVNQQLDRLLGVVPARQLRPPRLVHVPEPKAVGQGAGGDLAGQRVGGAGGGADGGR